MPETNEKTDAGRPVRRRRWLWIGGGALAGAAALGAAAAPHAWAFRDFAGGGHGRHRLGAAVLHDPALAKEHAGMALEWLLRGVSASQEQKLQAKRIAGRLIDELAPLAAEHREHRLAIVRELAKPQIDREAIEKLRREEISLADQASQKAVAAIADLAEVLTPEQRGEILTFAQRMHGHGPGAEEIE